MSPLFLFERALDFPNGELFITYNNFKMVKNKNSYSLKR
jgi:hypothetical protein